MTTEQQPVITYYPGTDKIQRISYFDADEKYHREDGPAYITFTFNGVMTKEVYYRRGFRTRDPSEGPAFTEYYANGEKYLEIYMIADLPHNPHGPAKIWYFENKKSMVDRTLRVHQSIWFLNGLQHCDSGPADTWYWEDGQVRQKKYFRHGVSKTEELLECGAINYKGNVSDQVMFDYYWGLL